MQAFYEFVIYFVMFSFCGWVCESVFCSINEKKIVNRGFLNGPVCPVYGFGGLIVVYILAPFQNNIPILFILGMISTTILEYITSFILEKLFHTKWWDYKENRFNINGRVCLQFSIVFGALSVAAVKLLYPPFYTLVSKIPVVAKPALAWSLLGILLADSTITVVSILRMNGKLAEMQQVMLELKVKLESKQSEKLTFSQWMQQLSEGIHTQQDIHLKEKMEQASAKIEGLLAQKGFQKFQIKRLSKAFPGMQSTRYKEQMAKLKEQIMERKNKKDQEN